MGAVNPFSDAVTAIIEAGGEALRTCYQCGMCTGTCPWNLVREFPVRRLLHAGQAGLLLEIGEEENWLCTTCGACVARCPRGVAIIDIFRAIRRIGMKYNAMPKALRTVLAGIRAQGNPWNDTRENRTVWMEGHDIRLYEAGMEYLYVPCCTPIYDEKARRIAYATTELLAKAGVSFGVLGREESCCGESVRKLGNEDLFRNLAESNIRVFREKGVHRIVVSSPHCYHTFKHEYAELGGNFEVLHVTELLLGLLEDGRLKPDKSYPVRVAYHDPCYLGRHNGIYEEPRELLRKIPDLELVELPDAREESICCGGGGGRIWMETKKEERLSGVRVDQAIRIGAKTLALSCPYCMLNFDDTVMTAGKTDILEIRDITEILNSVVGWPS